MLLTWVVAINSTRNEEFSVKTLEGQQKVYVAFMRLINTLSALGHCAIWKYIYHTWMEGVSSNGENMENTALKHQIKALLPLPES